MEENFVSIKAKIKKMNKQLQEIQQKTNEN